MAEFCPKCWNKLNGTHYPNWWYILSDTSDFCEECKQWKPVIVVERRAYIRRQMRKFFAKK